MRFETSTQSLRDALTAVLPCTSTDQDDYDRVRLELADSTLLISAVNGVAAITVRVSVDAWEGHPGGAPHFDLTREDAKKILDVHKMPRGDGVTPDEVTLLVTITDATWRSQDSSGLFDSAEALELSLAALPAVPIDVVGMIGENVATWMTDAQGDESFTLKHTPVTMSLAPFDKAQKTYRRPIVVRLAKSRRNALVQVGTQAIGLIRTADVTSETYRADDKAAADADAWKTWALDLPDGRRQELTTAHADVAPTTGVTTVTFTSDKHALDRLEDAAAALPHLDPDDEDDTDA